VVESKLAGLVDFAKANMVKDSGEIQVLTQFVLEMAPIHPQRVWRGYQARLKCKDLSAHFRFVAMTAAALEIQRQVVCVVMDDLLWCTCLHSNFHPRFVFVVVELFRSCGLPLFPFDSFRSTLYS
jgi:hypothetical protein